MSKSTNLKDINILLVSRLDDMSNIEHLIENAITCIEKGVSYNDFKTSWYNKEMLKEVKASPMEIWEIAIYVCTTYHDEIVWRKEDELEERYGYKAPD